jgi:hypothetical protein
MKLEVILAHDEVVEDWEKFHTIFEAATNAMGLELVAIIHRSHD